MDVSDRQRRILDLAVEGYIKTGAPVSSQAIAAELKEISLSPATVRCVMAELEQQGLLARSHVSAGRIPTEAGLRSYLDESLIPRSRPWDRARLHDATQPNPKEDFASQLGKSLAGLSAQMTVVAMPEFLGSGWQEIGLARCGRGQFVAFLVSPEGFVHQQRVHVDFDLKPEELQEIENYLNTTLRGRSVQTVHKAIEEELEAASARHDRLRRSAWIIGQRALPKPGVRLTVEGTANLAKKTEFAEQTTLHRLLEAVEKEQAILGVLKSILHGAEKQGGEVKVILGSEHEVAEVNDLACVGAGWVNAANGNTAAVALLGPARMDYERLVPMVHYATELLGKHWEKF